MRRLVSPLGNIVRQLAYSHDGQTLLAYEGDKTNRGFLRWWNLATCESSSTTRTICASQVAMSLAADLVVYAGFDDPDNEIVVWRTTQQHREATILPWDDTDALAVTGDGKTVAFASPRWESHQPARSEIRLASAADLAIVDTHRRYLAGEHVGRLAFSPHGRYLASVGATQLTLRDLELGDTVLARPTANTTQLRFSNDSRLLAVATGEYVQLWDVLRLVQRQTLLGHKATVHALAFSPDSRTLATGGDDRVVKLWDLTDGKLIRTYEWPTGPVLALAFAPDGLTAAAGGESGEIVIWDLDE